MVFQLSSMHRAVISLPKVPVKFSPILRRFYPFMCEFDIASLSKRYTTRASFALRHLMTLECAHNAKPSGICREHKSAPNQAIFSLVLYLLESNVIQKASTQTNKPNYRQYQEQLALRDYKME